MTSPCLFLLLPLILPLLPYPFSSLLLWEHHCSFLLLEHTFLPFGLLGIFWPLFLLCFIFPHIQRDGRNFEDQLVQFSPFVGEGTEIWTEQMTSPGSYSQAGTEPIFHSGLSVSEAAAPLLSSLAL